MKEIEASFLLASIPSKGSFNPPLPAFVTCICKGRGTAKTLWRARKTVFHETVTVSDDHTMSLSFVLSKCLGQKT